MIKRIYRKLVSLLTLLYYCDSFFHVLLEMSLDIGSQTMHLIDSQINSQQTMIISPIRFIKAFHVEFINTIKHHSVSASAQSPSLSPKELAYGCRLGLDSHADVSCVGRHARILEVFHGKTCNVLPFNDSYKAMTGIQTVNAAFAFDSEDGRTYVLYLNQCLNFTATMDHSLLCQNQCRANGVVIDDVPQCLDYHKTSTHSIWFPDEDIRMPLLMNGPISFLPVRYPTEEEMDTCIHLELTSYDEWDPKCFDGIDRGISSLSYHELHEINSNDSLYDKLQRQVYINAISHGKSNEVTPE